MVPARGWKFLLLLYQLINRLSLYQSVVITRLILLLYCNNFCRHYYNFYVAAHASEVLLFNLTYQLRFIFVRQQSDCTIQLIIIRLLRYIVNKKNDFFLKKICGWMWIFFLFCCNLVLLAQCILLSKFPKNPLPELI